MKKNNEVGIYTKGQQLSRIPLALTPRQMKCLPICWIFILVKKKPHTLTALYDYLASDTCPTVGCPRFWNKYTHENKNA